MECKMEKKDKAVDFVDSQKYPPGKSPLEVEKEEQEKGNEGNKRKDETDALGHGIGKSWFSRKKTTDKNVYVMPTSRNAEEYNMDLAKRGMALIFLQKTFSKNVNVDERSGSDMDRDRLKDAMLHLGFKEDDILVFEDLTRSELIKELDKVAAMDHTDHDCLVVAISTHGNDDGILFAKDAWFRKETLWEPFVGHKCITLAGKPKMFFIQACQGGRKDSGQEVDSFDEVDTPVAHYKIPSYADLLIYYSTMAGFFSWRHPIEGSWFVQSLCHLIKEKGHKLDFLSLLTLVNHRVAYEYMSTVPHTKRDGMKQIPCITSMLTRKIFFKPKAIKPPCNDDSKEIKDVVVKVGKK